MEYQDRDYLDEQISNLLKDANWLEQDTSLLTAEERAINPYGMGDEWKNDKC
jgi:hypothetical protein